MKNLENKNKALIASGMIIAALAVGVFSFYNNSVKTDPIEDSTEVDIQTELAEESTEKTFRAEELAWMESEADRILAIDAARESSLAEEVVRKESVAAFTAQTEAATQDEAEAKTQSFHFDEEVAGDTVAASETETTTYTEKVIPKEDPTVQTNGDYSGIIQNPSQAASGNTYSEPITTTEPESTTLKEEEPETTTAEQDIPETTTSSDMTEPESTTAFVEQDTTSGNITSWDAFWATAEGDGGASHSIPAHFDLTGEHTGY